MSTLFHQIYNLIRARKLLSLSLLAIILGWAVFASINIRLEENIINIMPKDETVMEVNEVFEGIKINNRIVFHVYNVDSTKVTPDSLVQVAALFADSLKSSYPEYFTEIKLEIPDQQLMQMYNYYYNNLPYYLLPEDYDHLDSTLSEQAIKGSIERVYKQLLSSVGVASKFMIKDPLGLTGRPLRRMQKNQLDGNFGLYQNNIVTKDHKHLIFFVVLSNPPNETSNNGKFIEGINQLQSKFRESHPTIVVDYFGPAAVAVANASRIKADVFMTVGVAMVALLIFISLFYRNIGTFFIVVTPGLFGGIMAIAFLSTVRPGVSIISLAVGSVLLGITIDYALHFFTHYKKEKNLKKLFEDITGPMLMSSLTTSFAFFSLIFIRSSALQDLGIFAGVSVLASVFYTLVVLPHVVSKLAQKEEDHKRMNLVERVVDKIATYPFYKRKWAIGVFVLLSVVSLFTWRHVTFESNMLELNYMPDQLQASQDRINTISNFTANNIYVAFRGENLDEVLQKNKILNQQLQALKDDSAIFDFYSLNQIIPAPDLREKRVNQWNAFWLKHADDSVMIHVNEAARKFGFKDNTFKSFNNLLNKEYNDISREDKESVLELYGNELIIDESDNRVSVLTAVTLELSNKSAVLGKLENIPGIIILDKAYLTSKLVELLKQDFGRLVNISLAVVFLIILISYGRIELTLITFTPIILSWLWVLGLMGWLGLSFNIVNIIICTFIFGLGVDYSIFVMRGLTQKYAYGVDNLVSYKKSIILSVVTTLLGIGVLALAKHPALQSIALLAIIGILSVVFITFTVEHLLYDIFILRRKKKGVVPFTLRAFVLSSFAFGCFLFGCLMLFFANILFKIPIGSLKRRKRSFHQIIMFFSYFVMYAMRSVKKKIEGKEYIDYENPSVIIANHHSFIDILVLLMLNPKVVMVTNDWVYNSPLFGRSIRYADFIQASKGIENQIDKIKDLVADGYSIIVFPEGTRSRTANLGRFHKGAFFLAETLELDIQPVVLHGTHMLMPSGDDYCLRSGTVTIKFLPRICHNDRSYGEDYRERAKSITKYFKAEYQLLRGQQETITYFKRNLLKNYLYKTPVIEWYIKIKYNMEGGYKLFDELVPLNAKVVDIGCGYGPMSYALGFRSSQREIFGIDYDDLKICVANNCPVKPDNIHFETCDALTYEFSQSDVYIISDVLHYLTPKEQKLLLQNVEKNLSAGGRIIIRDGDSSKKERHKGTVLTEIFSTGIGFNKTRNKLSYISSDMISDFAKANNLHLEIIDNTKRTSNTTFVLSRN
ncbi:1-acyl-sn-glycerol-3-phosphate acyltransferase [Fulvivirga sediminis]|uniref:1-acyl-sn-glycerol-3-phosphate acyltransferase n=1 Tax=Fulvivirga sediminis TaxID=2803949 RepID=A0A937JZN5_9BACT|nr:1-acyl-sn-glycerol-3-phosphate acyltransferase [Fulvivirga sediminis]MBL3656829.1 1-acyl-sn-glycerol-3-phosphate acyltransferase [Fulvivirga sediminis]